MTEAAYRDLGREMSGEFVKGEESCEGLGRVTTYVQLMGDATERERGALYSLPPDALKARVRQYLRWAAAPGPQFRAVLEQFWRPVKPVGWLRRAGFVLSQFLLAPFAFVYFWIAIPRRMVWKKSPRASTPST
jgi:hypothetical protein